MFIYEVNLFVEYEIARDYAVWLKKHIEEMLQKQGFLSAEFYECSDEDIRKKHWCIQYRIESMQDLQNYLDNEAEEVRAESTAIFGENFSASRRVLTKSEL